MNEVKNVVIVAGGKNTRFKEMSIFPKILLPLHGKPSILSYDIDLFSKFDLKTYLVINKDYENMVRDYVKNNNINVEIIVSTNQDGSANTLKEVKNKLPKSDTLLVWSDLILAESGLEILLYNIKERTADNLIVTRRGDYRLRVSTSNNILKVQDVKADGVCGNIPGIFYYKKRLSFGYDENLFSNFDYVNYLDLLNDDKITLDVVTFHGGITEFRDLEIYKNYYTEYLNASSKTRYFNSMSVNDDETVLTKRCINKEFDHLIEKEIEWYSIVKDKDLDCIPKIYKSDKENHSIEMEYLKDYIPIHQYLSSGFAKETYQEFFINYFNEVDKLHNSKIKEVSKLDIDQDCYKEFYDKVLERCDKISGMLIDYDREQLKELLDKANQIILKEVLNQNLPFGIYHFTHGDLNGSNVLYNPKTKSFKFIDPRGYFGKTKMMGLKEYDYAKILYCLSGYDHFNNEPYIFTKSYYETPTKIIDGTNIPKELRKPVYFIMVSIIWISLAQYISQDIFKANIAYKFGLDSLYHYIHEYETNEHYEKYLKEENGNK